MLLLSLHCGTWDMYPVAVPLNAHVSIVQVKYHHSPQDFFHGYGRHCSNIPVLSMGVFIAARQYFAIFFTTELTHSVGGEL